MVRSSSGTSGRARQDVADVIAEAVSEDQFIEQYARIWDGDERWTALPTPTGPAYDWDPDSTYVREPPFFQKASADPVGSGEVEGSRIEGARILVAVGDSITTDHISPAGAIRPDSPAGRYLLEHGVPAAGLQLVRGEAREPRGDDAGNVRERAPAQRARAGDRGTVDDPSPER